MRPLLWGIDFERGVGSFLRLDSLPMSYELCIQLTSLPLLNYCRYITLVILPLKYAGAYMLHLDLAPAPGSDRLSDDPERSDVIDAGTCISDRLPFRFHLSPRHPQHRKTGNLITKIKPGSKISNTR